MLAAISLLAWRLHKNRQQLQQSNQQLTAALVEVQQLNTTLEHFIQIIAHDMRKPLISFRGLADHISLLLRQQAYDDIRIVSNAIDSTGIQIETMLDNLLRWALTQREPIPYQPRALHLATIIENVVGLYGTLSHNQTVSIFVHCPESLSVWADPNALELIIRNLIDNALKQLQPNGQITISCQPDGDACVQIQIADTGRGMATGKLAFLQGILSGQEPGRVGQNGLGVGLLLVRDFIQRNKGYITIDSIRGQGTTFRLYVPKTVDIPFQVALVS